MGAVGEWHREQPVVLMPICDVHYALHTMHSGPLSSQLLHSPTPRIGSIARAQQWASGRWAVRHRAGFEKVVLRLAGELLTACWLQASRETSWISCSFCVSEAPGVVPWSHRWVVQGL